MSTAALVTTEDYLRMVEKPAYELREGALSQKSMPTKLHGALEVILVLMLRKLGLEAYPEVTVRLSADKYLVPHVIAAPVIQSPYPTEPVLLCCEILSPEDRLGVTFAKCEEYHAWGVPYCWVIDPVKRAAWEYPSGGEPVRVSGELHAGEITITIVELFSALPSA
jgi:Uma2 family endonuclease